MEQSTVECQYFAKGQQALFILLEWKLKYLIFNRYTIPNTYTKHSDLYVLLFNGILKGYEWFYFDGLRGI